jgi:hypothetical protein
VLKLSDYSRADCLGWHEWEQHRDVGWDAEPGIGDEPFPVPSHGRVSLRYLNEQDALGTWGRHARNANTGYAG